MALAQGDDAEAFLRPLDASIVSRLANGVVVAQGGTAEVVP
jgi:hypothetical protein